MIKLNEETRKFCKLQRTGYGQSLTDEEFDFAYNKHISNDIEIIKDFINNNQNLNICDIGCGVGAVDILLYKNFNIKNMTLIDKNGQSDKIYYGFKKEASYYNEFELTKNLLIENDIPINIVKFINVNKDKLPFNEKYDVIISFFSLSFHYPYSTYSDFIEKTLKSDGFLILDVRDNTNEIKNILLNNFKKCKLIRQDTTCKRLIFYK
jgi:SAM-dependent methyltransferase